MSPFLLILLMLRIIYNISIAKGLVKNIILFFKDLYHILPVEPVTPKVELLNISSQNYSGSDAQSI